ncbi:MAG TPA: DUF4386 family protein [Thermoleophilaceae bacterium]|nr:DUF4386 family protein [Thermoleophilaceae bacterium]
MAHDEQLAWEERAGKPAAAAAIGSGVTAIASGIYLASAVSDQGEGADGLLEAAADNGGAYVGSSVVQAVGFLLLIPALMYLYRAVRYRRPETMSAAAVLLVLGGLTLAVTIVLRRIELVDIAEGFVPDSGDVGEEAAENEIEDNVSTALQGIGLGGALALAFSVVMIALNAMRAGLLSRFMGILGIFVGAVFVIPLGTPILQLFWLGALGALYLGRWPGGRGPAWQTGEAIPWPGASEQREEIERRRAEREGVPDPEPDADGSSDSEEAESEPERPASRKRRKKRR